MTTSTRPAPSRPAARSSVRPGFSPELFDRLWDIHDIAAFIDASDATAWRAMNREDAPPRLYLGTKTVRWDPNAVVTFLLGRTNRPNATGKASTKRGTGLHAVADSDRVTVITPGRASVSSATTAMRPARAHGHRGARS